MKNKILTGILTTLLLTTSGGCASMYIKAENLEAIIEKKEVDSKKKSTEIANLKETVEYKDFDLKANELVIEGKIAEIKTLKIENEKLKHGIEDLKVEIKEIKKLKSEALSNSKSSEKALKTLTVNASAYIAFCKEGCTGRTRSGYDVSNTIYYNGMRIIASDTSFLPMHSIVKIEGFTDKFIVLDTGGGIKGNKIDVLFNSESEAIKFGRKNLKLQVIRNGK